MEMEVSFTKVDVSNYNAISFQSCSHKAIALVQTHVLAGRVTLDMIAELQCASNIVRTEDGVWRLTLVNALRGTVATTVACLYATRDFLYRFMSFQSGQLTRR